MVTLGSLFYAVMVTLDKILRSYGDGRACFLRSYGDAPPPQIQFSCGLAGGLLTLLVPDCVKTPNSKE